MEPFIGQIQALGFNFAPRGWAKCEGQILAINSNPSLFSLIGTTYGGDGRTTFGLPDLRGRSIVHVGTGGGLDNIRWGERGGNFQHTLSTNEMPKHNHNVAVSTAEGEESNPQNNVIASQAGAYNEDATSGTFMNGSSVTNTGNGAAFNIRNPFL